ncbi:EF-hand superfamily Ca2+-modulated protein [Periconia macrospinosa]|uniref:EF-hand superfamily Ca2+-modulated protein n=1 Tax=Periconia macrospinosa TaxID=97972 RepID=A0A2V1DMN2_9PLEO|nr:EF-hand superfamily Ca2+-modulated protein [Periconia macrospinosa]
MPPKRRTQPARATSNRPSKLAKEHGITAAQEAEIREAFGLFAIQHPEHSESKEGVLRRDDVRRCLISLNLPPNRAELPEILSTIDPLNTGVVEFIPFISYAAIAIHSKDSSSPSASDDEYDDDGEGAGQYRESNAQEVQAAFRLFTHGGAGPITLAHLRRVAKELKEDVPDSVLRDMILEANGGVKGKGKGKDVGSVGIEEFESVMKRAGISFV